MWPRVTVVNGEEIRAPWPCFELLSSDVEVGHDGRRITTCYLRQLKGKEEEEEEEEALGEEHLAEQHLGHDGESSRVMGLPLLDGCRP